MPSAFVRLSAYESVDESAYESIDEFVGIE